MRAKEVLTKNPLAKNCQLHDELLKMFCFDCNRLICCECAVKDHRDHDFEFNDVAATNKRKELMVILKPLREMVASLSLAVEEILTMERKLEAQGESVANKINTSFEEFHTIVERRKQQMLEEARRKVSKKMENLHGQKKSMSISGAEVQSIMAYGEWCVKHCSDDAVLYMHAEIGSRIKQEIQGHKPGRSLVPVEDVDVGVEVGCAEGLEQLLQTQAKITQLPVSLVINKVSGEAEVSKLSEVILYTTELCNKPAKHGVKIDCHLKSLCNGSLIKSKI